MNPSIPIACPAALHTTPNDPDKRRWLIATGDQAAGQRGPGGELRPGDVHAMFIRDSCDVFRRHCRQVGALA